MVEGLEELIFQEIPQIEPPKVVKRCEWCQRSLPSNDRYQLRICPRCRKESVAAFLKNNRHSD